MSSELQPRLVRYAELRPCTTAFIDARTPGSDRKENFTIIGPGVAENPDQYVHIDIPHGFNVGGARQPPHCVNSQHSHETAEVFIIHSGTWRFKTGEHGSDGAVDLFPGDVISIPTHVFRGFENIGDDTGFMFSVLGGDDPGQVMWAPYVFDAARQHGLVLLVNGRLIDTHREAIPPGALPREPTSRQDAELMRRLDSTTLASCVVRRAELSRGGGISAVNGFDECPVIGSANPDELMPAAKIAWPHDFQLRALRIRPGALCPPYLRHEPEVFIVHLGRIHIAWNGGSIELLAGDTMSFPIGVTRTIENPGNEEALVFVVRGGELPEAPEWQVADKPC